jgi:two-component system, LuxR family, response regulator FixJ
MMQTTFDQYLTSAYAAALSHPRIGGMVKSKHCGREANRGNAMKQVFYADGEKASTGVVEAALRQLDLRVKHFDSAEQCLDCLGAQECHLLVSNARRPAKEGMTLLAGAKRVEPSVPFILLVDHGDIQAAVRAMKGGAIDCLERPPEKTQLVSAIDSVLQESVLNRSPLENPLSKTEEQVLRLILQGNTTAKIARTLRRSRRTIEVHRSHVMQKLGVHSVVDLVRTCLRMGLLRDWP